MSISKKITNGLEATLINETKTWYSLDSSAYGKEANTEQVQREVTKLIGEILP